MRCYYIKKKRTFALLWFSKTENKISNFDKTKNKRTESLLLLNYKYSVMLKGFNKNEGESK